MIRAIGGKMDAGHLMGLHFGWMGGGFDMDAAGCWMLYGHDVGQ
jgi:hypothetical protein